MRGLTKTVATNAALENEVREYLQMSEEIRQDHLVKILGLLEPETYVALTHVTEISSGLTATSAIWVKKDSNHDWEKMVKSRTLVKVSISRKGRNNLSFSRDNRRFKVTGM